MIRHSVRFLRRPLPREAPSVVTVAQSRPSKAIAAKNARWPKIGPANCDQAVPSHSSAMAVFWEYGSLLPMNNRPSNAVMQLPMIGWSVSGRADLR
jgi:hypothetical protein